MIAATLPSRSSRSRIPTEEPAVIHFGRGQSCSVASAVPYHATSAHMAALVQGAVIFGRGKSYVFGQDESIQNYPSTRAQLGDADANGFSKSALTPELPIDGDYSFELLSNIWVDGYDTDAGYVASINDFCGVVNLACGLGVSVRTVGNGRVGDGSRKEAVVVEYRGALPGGYSLDAMFRRLAWIRSQLTEGAPEWLTAALDDAEVSLKLSASTPVEGDVERG